MSQFLIYSWIFLLLEFLLIFPLALYIGGKIMKVPSEKFTFIACVWINFIAGLLAGFAFEVHWILSLTVFVALLTFLIRRQFKASVSAIIVMILLSSGVAAAMTYTKPFFLNKLLDSSMTVESELDEEIVEIINKEEKNKEILYEMYNEVELRGIFMEYQTADETRGEVFNAFIDEKGGLKFDQEESAEYEKLGKLYLGPIKEKYNLSDDLLDRLDWIAIEKGWLKEYINSKKNDEEQDSNVIR